VEIMREQKIYFATKRQARSKSRESGRAWWPEGGEDAEQGVEGDEHASRLIEAELAGALGIRVRVHLEAVQVVPAEVHFDLVDADDEILASGSVLLRVDAPESERSFRVRAEPRIVQRHVVWGVLLSMYETVHLRWEVQVVDPTGRMLGRKTLEDEMHAP
jgi:hypothetical protein